MNVMADVSLVDVLRDWGKHEAIGRGEADPRHFEGTNGDFLAVNCVLQFRAPLIARILLANVLNAQNAELEQSDIPLLRLADGRAIDEWVRDARKDEKSYEYYRALVDGKDRVKGPIVCVAQRESETIFIFDGWHRAAAWTEQLKRDQYPISAYLILTEHPVRLLST